MSLDSLRHYRVFHSLLSILLFFLPLPRSRSFIPQRNKTRWANAQQHILDGNTQVMSSPDRVSLALYNSYKPRYTSALERFATLPCPFSMNRCGSVCDIATTLAHRSNFWSSHDSLTSSVCLVFLFFSHFFLSFLFFFISLTLILASLDPRDKTVRSR